MYHSFWSDYTLLFIAAIVGSIAILPYGLRLANESAKKKPVKLPHWALLLLSILQNAVLFAIVIAVGLLAVRQIGLNPLRGDHLLIALFLGIVAGSVLLVMDLLFLPHLPERLLTTALKTTQLENFMASFYGGINEELLMRLFGLSVVAWLLSRVWHTASGSPTTAVFWVANVILAVAFALGHLPALKALVGNITSVLLARTLLLNMAVGLLCGWLFWNYSIVAAMIAHFAADIIYHVGGTFVLHWKFAKKS
jgi:hypothetical protein